eukprot:TRINITY_DN10684_c0_g1_i1.p1 TRINITY_DN10684_c0_g1~~TRINITY_DN10684_c0_g1_i1.p1  ORF type:complete len:101 (-),score=10.85 TRINITY_DN10684_c0_g1_i1:24-326(-)
MIIRSCLNDPKTKNTLKNVGGSTCQNIQNQIDRIVKQKVQNQTTNQYNWNSEEINQILHEEINETFPTYYDEYKYIDDTWKPISLQGEKSRLVRLVGQVQ